MRVWRWNVIEQDNQRFKEVLETPRRRVLSGGRYRVRNAIDWRDDIKSEF